MSSGSSSGSSYVGRRGGAKPAPLTRRFWEKLEIQPDGCWQWRGAINDDRYPVLWDGKRLTYAHRISHELFLGPVPSGMDVDHLCNNRLCVNPGHLEAVSHRTNVARAFARRRAA